jgi:hypothetical protein
LLANPFRLDRVKQTCNGPYGKTGGVEQGLVEETILEWIADLALREHRRQTYHFPDSRAVISLRTVKSGDGKQRGHD